jgi:hypothetical protein
MVVRCPPSFIKITRLNIVYLSGDRLAYIYAISNDIPTILDIFREKVAKVGND